MQVTYPGMNFIYFSGCACGLKERRWGTASVMNCRLHETLSPSIFNHLGASRVWKSSLIEFSHPSYCTFMPLCHWLITWQQHRAFRHVNMVRMSSWGLEWASDVKRKRGFNSISGCFLVAGFLECFTRLCWSNCFHLSPGFSEKVPNKTKYPTMASTVPFLTLPKEAILDLDHKGTQQWMLSHWYGSA